MSSPEGLLGSFDFGGILRSLLPDDDLPRHKYIRSFGARMFFPAFIILLSISIVQSYFGIGLWLPLFIVGGVMVIGFFITLYGLYLGKEFEDIDKRDREAKVERQETVKDILNDRQMSLKERRIKYSDEDMDVELEPVTIEPSDKPPNTTDDRKHDTPSKDERELDHEK